MNDLTHAPHEPGEFDSELPVRAIFGSIVGIALLIAFSFVAMWFFSKVLKARSIAEDPAALPVAEANQPRPRPRAALQTDPTADMIAFAKEEEAAISSYAWVDPKAGVVRIPVERAIEIVAQKGLPVPPALPNAPTADAATTGTAPVAAPGAAK